MEETRRFQLPIIGGIEMKQIPPSTSSSSMVNLKASPSSSNDSTIIAATDDADEDADSERFQSIKGNVDSSTLLGKNAPNIATDSTSASNSGTTTPTPDDDDDGNDDERDKGANKKKKGGVPKKKSVKSDEGTSNGKTFFQSVIEPLLAEHSIPNPLPTFEEESKFCPPPPPPHKSLDDSDLPPSTFHILKNSDHFHVIDLERAFFLKM